MRHDKITNAVDTVLKQAGFRTKREQKYDINKLLNKQSNNILINADSALKNGVPGDILVEDWDQGEDAYFDVVVGNIFAASYVKQSATRRLWLANEKEKLKRKISKS